jgi:hypothetical protein
MISTRFGQFSEEQIAKKLCAYFKRNDTCRQQSEEILRQQFPKTLITPKMIDTFIRYTLVPECIKDGTAARLLEKFGEKRPETLSRIAVKY